MLLRTLAPKKSSAVRGEELHAGCEAVVETESPHFRIDLSLESVWICSRIDFSIATVLFTAWVLLFIVQTALIARHRTTMHRNVGMFGTGLAFLMVAAGALTAINQLNTKW